MRTTATVLSLFPDSDQEYLIANFGSAARSILENRAPAVMGVPNLRTETIEAAFKGLRQFSEKLSSREQSSWTLHVPRDPKYDEPDDGLIRKSGADPTIVDNKYFFHYRRDLKELLHKKKGIALCDWQEEWFDHMDHLSEVCTEAFLGIARQMDALWPGYQFERRAEKWKHLNCLRILRYEMQTGTLARRHTDRAGITFQIAQSCPGLYSTHGLEVRKAKNPSTPNVLAFAGDQLANITSDEVKRCWHLVDDETGGTEVRESMVFFGKFYTGEL